MKGKIVTKKVLDGAGEWVLSTTYFLHGVPVTEAEFKAAFPDADPGDAGPALVRWQPLHSEALAVHSKLVKQQAEKARARGVPTEFDRAGRPVFTSRRHRRDYLRAFGCHDRSGGYGDG